MSVNGTVVGYCGDAGLTYHAFILKKGVVTLVDYPGAHLTEFLGINRKGAIGGVWCDIGCGTEEAFMFDPVTSAFNVIDIPGAAWSGAGGLNDAGVVTVNSDLGSYIYCPKKKTCPIQSPNAVEVPDRIIHAKVETRICEHDCVYQAHIPSDARH